MRLSKTTTIVSACGLTPHDVIDLERPDLSEENTGDHEYQRVVGDNRLFAGCIAVRRDFHIDPYGGMTFCAFIKDPSMRYDLRQGTLVETWSYFVMQELNLRSTDKTFLEKCLNYPIINLCLYCPANAYLECGRIDGWSEYFCQVALARAAVIQGKNLV